MKKRRVLLLRILAGTLVFCLQVVLAFGALEIGIRASAVGWKHVYRFIHRHDPDYHVYIVGESTSYGEPFASKVSYPRIASYILGDAIGSKNIHLINLAGSGRSLEYEYWRLFQELSIAPRAHGTLLIYAGINDNSINRSDPGLGKWRLTQRSIIASRLYYVLEGKLFESIYTNNNSLYRFEERLRKIISLAKQYNLRVCISTLAGNIADFSPQDNGIFALGDSRTSAAFSLGLKHEASGEYEKAIRVYRELLHHFEPGQCGHLYYRLACSYAARGEYALARGYYWKAVNAGDPVRPNFWMNGIIRKLSRENNVLLVDSLRAFEAAAPHHLPGYNLFVDAHHPTLKGYGIIAQGFARGIAQLTGARLVHASPSEQEIREHFNITDQDMMEAYLSRVWWLCMESTTVVFREDRLLQAEKYLQLISLVELYPDKCFWHFFISVLRKDKNSALYWIQEGKLLTDNKTMFRKHVNPQLSGWVKDNVTFLPMDISRDIQALLLR